MPALTGHSIQLWQLTATLKVDNLDEPVRVGDAAVIG